MNREGRYCLEVDNQLIEFAPSGREEIDVDAPNKILCVSVTNIVHPVNVDVLSQVFESYGPIYKILICPRPNGVQAFIELEAVEKGISAKDTLDGKNLYHDCNFIRITYSRFKTLEIRHQGELQVDFTRQGQDSVNGAGGQGGAGGANGQGGVVGNSKAAKKLKNKQQRTASTAFNSQVGAGQGPQGHSQGAYGQGQQSNYYGGGSAAARHGSNSRADQERAQREGLYYGHGAQGHAQVSQQHAASAYYGHGGHAGHNQYATASPYDPHGAYAYAQQTQHSAYAAGQQQAYYAQTQAPRAGSAYAAAPENPYATGAAPAAAAPAPAAGAAAIAPDTTHAQPAPIFVPPQYAAAAVARPTSPSAAPAALPLEAKA